jgi:hypothetical protein
MNYAALYKQKYSIGDPSKVLKDEERCEKDREKSEEKG